MDRIGEFTETGNRLVARKGWEKRKIGKSAQKIQGCVVG